jgi:hypothetical protein
MGETTQHALKEIRGFGSVAEDDGRFGGIAVRGQENMEERFAMRHRNLEICLFEGRRNWGVVFGSDLRHED